MNVLTIANDFLTFRAIADQFNLSSLPNSTGKLDFQAVRRLAADHIRSNAEVYAPFMGISASSEDFNTYCFKVESSELAEWGGELELRALAEALQREILVYSADAPVLTMTAVYVSNPIPLRLSFHQHYYSLGEHYNSVIPNVN